MCHVTTCTNYPTPVARDLPQTIQAAELPKFLGLPTAGELHNAMRPAELPKLLGLPTAGELHHTAQSRPHGWPRTFFGGTGPAVRFQLWSSRLRSTWRPQSSSLRPTGRSQLWSSSPRLTWRPWSSGQRPAGRSHLLRKLSRFPILLRRLSRCPVQVRKPSRCPAQLRRLSCCPVQPGKLTFSPAALGASSSIPVLLGTFSSVPAPSVCYLAEAALFPDTARDRSHRGPEPPLEGGALWRSGRSAFGGGSVTPSPAGLMHKTFVYGHALLFVLILSLFKHWFMFEGVS
ncbi:hypothetical protein AMELA_G00279230 [Ameiurus melas]|uniref:Uncharacterized protein n=1 Tax=Ameiurus melas TaxID=219545 RepID=A0A7J5ZLY5_AMEME|nr:hypothetical protein AMELA_G00279230 [Ameiurus melas]